MTTSPFLERPHSDWIASNDLAFAIFDGFPVSPGHALVIPKRLVPTWFEASPEEQRAIMALVDVVKSRLDAEFRPDGYNIGINAGEAAGQTVFHLHVHLIPRYRGDMEDPRGGVRHVIPWKGNYKRHTLRRLATGDTDPFLAHLLPHFEYATEIAILAAFVQDSGLDHLETPLLDARARGARIRILTGDYLDITQARALRRLLHWSRDTFTTRVFETHDKKPPQAFHPKSWRFEGPDLGVSFVGSSNVSASALNRGIEWNLRLDRHEDPAAWTSLKFAFDALWDRARPLTTEWIAEYELRTRTSPTSLPHGEISPPAPPPVPHAVQNEALEALSRARAEGRSRALVVLATGLGKTWLAAFDLAACPLPADRPPKVLFLAHRDEILNQAADTFRRLMLVSRPEATLGFCRGPSEDLDADLVFASVQKVSRVPWLDRIAERTWDYVVVDEVHHATASSYRRILARLDSRFMLGLTATPDRSDEADILGLFDDHLAFRADLDRGIGAGLLVPFHYHGIKDTADFSEIPWRNRRFDPSSLEAAVQTEARMQSLWRHWQRHPGSKTLVFCMSLAHAEFVREWLHQRGVQIVAIHSGPTSSDRATSLQRLRRGDIEAICSVDLFNEGIDMPDIDRVVMLRPTDSGLLFLQQLGRGLRRAPGKSFVTVLDFVGNHRIFLDRIAQLASFGRPGSMREVEALLARDTLVLPEGCLIDIELEAIDMLRRLLPKGRSEFEQIYEARASSQDRPRLVDLYREGASPASVRDKHHGWFDFVQRRGDLTTLEQQVLLACREWLRELETSRMDKCFKAVVIQVLLDAESLHEGLPLPVLAEKSRAMILRSPELMLDILDVKELANSGYEARSKWEQYWRKNPIKAWTDGAFFSLSDRAGTLWLTPDFSVPTGLEDTLSSMTRELVEYRMAQYRNRPLGTRDGDKTDTFETIVGVREGDPLLMAGRLSGKFLDRANIEAMVDGNLWLFQFSQRRCREARPAGLGKTRNQLPDLLRRWFGPDAGRTATAKSVRFVREGDGFRVEPVGALSSRGADIIVLQPRARIRAFPTLRAAAGEAIGTSDPEGLDTAFVSVPDKPWASHEDVFLVRASGDSMEGGKRPIHDGDWVALRWARGLGLGALEGAVALLQVEDPVSGFGWQLKRVIAGPDGWELRSDNPARPHFRAGPDTVPVAVLVDILAPDEVIET